MIKNTLFIGNGFSRSLFPNIPGWDELFRNMPENLRKHGLGELLRIAPTLVYEVYRKALRSSIEDESALKHQLLEQIDDTFQSEDVACNSEEIGSFGNMLADHNVGDIITTNYDYGIEWILKKCGYEQKVAHGLIPEQIYNIRTYKVFRNDKTTHTVKLWKIHGDSDSERIKSVTLGFDQYCGTIAKEYDYVKGEYASNRNTRSNRLSVGASNPVCSASLKDKCGGKKCFDGISWIELFFTSNVYIVGFGMGFSEIDIWWLLNQYSRLKEQDLNQVNNTITFIDNKQYSVDEKIKMILKYFDVCLTEIPSIGTDPNYLSNIFKQMNNSSSTRV